VIIADETYGVIDGQHSAKGINKAIQEAEALGVNVMLPAGRFLLEEPILIHNNGRFARTSLIGQSTLMDWKQGTQLAMDYNSGYGIGIQLGKGVRIDGVSVVGKFAPNTSDFFRKKIEDFIDPKIVEDGYHPYSAITIDPINTGSNGGSTAVTIKNCRLFNTCAGVASSPNGGTRNAEMTTIENVQFGFNRVAVSASHDQERNCIIRDCFAWEAVHTFFSSHRYGVGIGGNWHIENINIAGDVNTFIEWNGIGRYMMTIEKINTERLGRFGFMKGHSIIRDSDISFVDPREYYGDWQVDLMHGVEVCNSKLRYYGHFIPVNIKGDATFNRCHFEVRPNYGLPPYYSGGSRKPIFNDCFVNTLPWVQADPVGDYLGRRKVSKGKFKLEHQLRPKQQLIYELNTRPWGWMNLGIATGSDEVSYSEVEGDFNLIAIK
jgi:hypothetical protein